MQAIWKGSVAFGLVNIPVKAFVATESHDVSFRQVHVSDGGRIQYRKVCSVCGETVQHIACQILAKQKPLLSRVK